MAPRRLRRNNQASSLTGTNRDCKVLPRLTETVGPTSARVIGVSAYTVHLVHPRPVEPQALAAPVRVKAALAPPTQAQEPQVPHRVPRTLIHRRPNEGGSSLAANATAFSPPSPPRRRWNGSCLTVPSRLLRSIFPAGFRLRPSLCL